jgi:hypothetical protein
MSFMEEVEHMNETCTTMRERQQDMQKKKKKREKRSTRTTLPYYNIQKPILKSFNLTNYIPHILPRSQFPMFPYIPLDVLYTPHPHYPYKIL